MPLVVKDRVRESTTTAGTGTITLGGAVTGFQSFSVIGNGNTTYYAIVSENQWEVGIGTYTASGTTLSRDTVLESSSGGAKVDFAVGTKYVFVTYPAEQSVDLDTAQTLTNKTISVDNNTVSGIAASSFVLSNSSGNIDGSASQKAIPSGVVVGTSDTQTLTNKRINPRVDSSASITSPLAWNSDNFDAYAATAQAGALTINADSGTPVNGQKIVFRFKDNGTARALTWTTGASKAFRAIGINLPTTTIINKTTYVGCIYNAADDRWDAIATATEA